MKRSNSSAKRKPTRRVAIVCLLAALVSLPFCISAYVCASAGDRVIPAEQAAALDADCILVLGARVWENGRLSGVLEDRMIVGLAAYEMGASDRLLLSGDHGQVEYDEVGAMKQYALEHGVPSEAVFMDHAGFSTYESLYRARDVFGARRIVIVTQRYHLYRALYIADKLGLDAYGVASDLRPYSGQARFELREIAARDKDFVMTILMPKPTYLGDPIPLTGNGNLTNG